MAIRLKINITAALKEAGYSSYRIRQEKIFGQRIFTKLNNGDLPSWHELDVICDLLGLQVGDIVEHVPDKPDE